MTAEKAAQVSSDPFESRRNKRQLIEKSGANPFGYDYKRTARAGDLQKKYENLESGVETEDQVSVAGRIMAVRNSGMFIDLQDTSGRIQVFCHKDTLPAEQMEKLDTLDIGDIIDATGTIRRTPRGELSVRCLEINVLTKALHPLPEKYHGLSDIEQRYRQRYIDLIVNPESAETLRKRTKIIQAIRNYIIEDWDGMEVETPMLHPIMGGASAKPFVTHHNALGSDFYLRVAPELYLKRLIVGGLSDCVFEINRCFRNEGISPKHNPEFTSIELYKAYGDYEDMIRLTEGVVQAAAAAISGEETNTITYQGTELNIGSPWNRKTMCELVEEHTGVDFMTIDNDADAIAKAKELKLPLQGHETWGHVVALAFEEKVEDKLIQPTHVTDFPLAVSPLAKNHRSDPRLTERFESYVNGWEIANAFTELNDPVEQRLRFEDQVKAREAGDEEAQMLDEDFITALEIGLPPTGGWGMGIDRLCMILTDSTNIRDVINFPTLKKIHGE